MTNKPISEVIAEIQRLLSSIEKYQRQGKVGEWVEEYRIATCPAELRRVLDHIAALEQQLEAEKSHRQAGWKEAHEQEARAELAEQQLAAERAQVPVAWCSKQYGTVWIKQLCQMSVGTEWFIRGSAEPVAVVKSSCSVLWNVSQKDLPHGTVFYACLPVEGE